MMIKGGKIQKANKKSLKAKGKDKANGKGKDKQVYIPKPKNHKPSAKEHLAKDDTCHHCKEVGHWKRNCPVYFAELLKKKKQVGSVSSSGIFTIELFTLKSTQLRMTLATTARRWVIRRETVLFILLSCCRKRSKLALPVLQ
ncbi:zinc finger, CCHC-type containing protein, partial [Tanacetum coccineum]